MAFLVDGLAGEQELVIKGLGPQLARVGGVAGATLLGNGDVVLVLNVADLIRLAWHGTGRPVFDAPGGTGRPRRRILIVDDSITTRTLEKNILEAAGYQVELATDGLEALSAIHAGGAPDLIVTDVLMPRLDGIELTRRVKGDARTAQLPLILVTSLDAPEHKARGLDAGADAYIVKGRFEQDDLLDTIAQLL
jgi:two-component system chemotaxis sensor kinase CheA